MANYVERVADRAAEVQILRLVLSLLALPFYVVGLVLGVLWLTVRWCYAAAVVGFEQLTQRDGDDDAG